MTPSAKERTYKPGQSVVFRVVADKFGGLSNMSSEFPLFLNDTQLWSSEALYQACRYPSRPDIQKLIALERSPMTAKMVSKHYLQYSRTNWERLRLAVMRWCLRVKLAQNWSRFGTLLLSTKDNPIVEESTRDKYWAAKRNEAGDLVGVNALGRLLMELREQLKRADRDRLHIVAPLGIKDFLFMGEQIGTIKTEEWVAPSEMSTQAHIDSNWRYQF